LPHNSKFILIFSVFITSSFITISYELKPFYTGTGIPPVLVAFFSFIFGMYMSDVAVNFLFSFRLVRKIIFGRAWLEGWWYLKAFEEIDGKFFNSSKAILQIQYVGSSLQLETSGYHITDKGEYVLAHSQIVTLRELDMLYSNHFTLGEGVVQKLGIAVGNFYFSSGKRFPTFYEGRTLYFDKSVMRRQVMHKLSESTVNKYIKKHGSKWIKKATEELSETF